MTHVQGLCNIVSKYELIDTNYLKNKFGYQDFFPEIIVFPNSIEEISEILKYCFKTKTPISPIGSGTKLFIGNPSISTKVLLSLRDLNRILDHEISDMVATVECGVEVGNFQNEVNKSNQLLPVDPPFLDSGATIGGLISTNLCGPLSTRFGTCRELLLSVRAVRADGQIIKGGAKVVKNVAGYDIPKLLVGSLGTLSIIVEASFRLFPRQECSETIVLGFDEFSKLHDVAIDILGADIVPSCMEIFKGEVIDNEFFKDKELKYVVLKLENFTDAVNEQINEIKKIAGNNTKLILSLKDSEEMKLWKDIREFPFNKTDSLLAKVILPINSCFNLLRDLENISTNLNVRIEAVSRPLRGGILISIDSNDCDILYAANLLRSQVGAIGGNIMFYNLNQELKNDIKVWDSFGSATSLMEMLKKQFDTNNILNPGKMFD